MEPGEEQPEEKKEKKLKQRKSAAEVKLVSDLIKESLSKMNDEHRARLYKEDCMQAVVATLDEFLTGYILIGYDFDGTPIKIVKATSGMQADALNTSLVQFVTKLQPQSPPPNV